MANERNVPSQWLWRLRKRSAQPPYQRYGAYGVELPRLSLPEISALSKAAGIHSDVLGPCRRGAAKLNWYLMFRPIKPSAMFHVGDFDKLPKPEEIKTKVDAKSGMIRYGSEREFTADQANGNIDRHYAERHGLKLDSQGFLINNKGQRFFSDMDLYDVLDGSTGRQVRLGSGGSKQQGIKNRRALDTLINIMRPLGTAFALIQHGPDRQWVEHEPRNEPITVFCPDGNVFVLKDDSEVHMFVNAIRSLGTGVKAGANA